MDEAEDFYMQEIAQVKMPHWTQGRVAVIGDAGYCPSPISGMGTTLAIIGAYILAGEIGASNGEYQSALAGYERKMKPYVVKAQSLPPGAPGVANPQTKWRIFLLHSAVGFVSWSRLPKVFSKDSSLLPEEKRLPLPEYGS
jgi:2-polyprenyl-6-methoxyphenol hydroxylase-like FAD-dependent oxidoreductase